MGLRMGRYSNIQIAENHEKAGEKRCFAADNVRFILIFLVVFAHLLETMKPDEGSANIYKAIYSFHMPALIFLFGYFARYNPTRIVFRWIIPYAVFQCAYLVFAILFLKMAGSYNLPLRTGFCGICLSVFFFN